MPEPYYVFCAVCEQSYDKWTTPTCPRCSDVRAPKKRAEEVPAKAKAPRPLGTSGGKAPGASKPAPRAGSLASITSVPGVVQDRPVTAAAAARSVKELVREDESGSYGFVNRAPLWGAGGFALGLLLYPLALNLIMEKPLFELPVLERIRGAEIVGTTANAADAGPVQVQVKLDQPSLDVTDWRREPGETAGMIKYIGTVENTSPGQVTKAIVQMHMEDLGGRELGKGWSWTQPSVIDPGARGQFEIELPESAVAATIRVHAGWHQYFKADISEIDPQAASNYFSEIPTAGAGEAPSELEIASAGSELR